MPPLAYLRQSQTHTPTYMHRLVCLHSMCFKRHAHMWLLEKATSVQPADPECACFIRPEELGSTMERGYEIQAWSQAWRSDSQLATVKCSTALLVIFITRLPPPDITRTHY